MIPSAVTLQTGYDPLLVVFSFVLSIVASYTALDLAGRVSADRDTPGHGWLLAGATTMGLGIWSMHFVGMTALHGPMRMSFDVALTVVSLLCSISGSAIALHVVSRPSLSWKQLGVGAFLMANTLGAMHYLGMLAMRTQAFITWHPIWIAASVGVALGACLVAMALAFRLKGESLAVWSGRKAASAVVMGLAIAGMHYTAMQASTFVPLVCTPGQALVLPFVIPPLSWPTVGLSQVSVMAIGFGTLFMLGSSLIGAYKDRLASSQHDLAAITRLNHALAGANAQLALQAEQLLAQQEELQRLYTQLKQHSELVEAEVASRTQELKAANEQLVLADRHKDDFLSVLSHELRTPLNFITGFASILEDEIPGELNASQHAYMGKIMTGADRMLRLVEDLLDIARIQAGKVVMDTRPTAYGTLVEDVAGSLKDMADQRGLALSWHIEEVGAPSLDEGRIIQVLTNLIGNAIKFTPKGGAVTVRASRLGDMLLTEVADTGPGIPADAAARVFEKFQQLDMSATRESGGTGLGLAIAKALVEAHGGTIGVDSRLGAGSTFWFKLPLASAAAPARTEAL